MTTIAAVNIGDSLQQALNGLVGFLPNLLAFIVILVVGYIIARVVKGIVTKLLEKAGLDKALHSGQTGEYVEKLSPGASPSKLVGTIGFWLIFLFVLSAAIGALRIPAVTSFMDQVLAYLPNVIAAVLIFVIAGAIAGAVAGLVAKLMGDTPTGKLVASITPALIMGIAVFMILNQLQIAPAIVTITYAVLLGSLGLGMALAFGLGGRETAAQLVSGAYEKGQEQRGYVKADPALTRDRGQEHADHRTANREARLATTNGPADDVPRPGDPAYRS
jgi:mechanosensitive ion channel-like protein